MMEDFDIWSHIMTGDNVFWHMMAEYNNFMTDNDRWLIFMEKDKPDKRYGSALGRLLKIKLSPNVFNIWI